MSNLNLPNLSYKSLDSIVAHGQRTKLAYETTAERMGDVFIIRHHGNAIAEVGMFSVDVSNCGWGSSTTRQRINVVLRSNGIKASVGQKNWEQKLTIGETAHNFARASFRMLAGLWEVTDIAAY